MISICTLKREARFIAARALPSINLDTIIPGYRRGAISKPLIIHFSLIKYIGSVIQYTLRTRPSSLLSPLVPACAGGMLNQVACELGCAPVELGR